MSSADLDSGSGSGDSQQPLRVQSLALDVCDKLETWTKRERKKEGECVCKDTRMRYWNPKKYAYNLPHLLQNDWHFGSREPLLVLLQ